MPIRRGRILAIVDAAMRDHAAGRSSSWAHGLGATVQDASRALGVLWNDRTALPDDVRWHAAATFRCEAREIATYGALAQRMLRQLPRHLPPDRRGADARGGGRGGPSPTRPAPEGGEDDLALRATIVEAARQIARDRGMRWTGLFGADAAEAVARLGRLWGSEAVVPDEVRSAMAHVLECPSAAIDTYGRLARRLAAALPRGFEIAAALEERERAAAEGGAADGARGPGAPATPPRRRTRAQSGVRSRSSIGELRVLVVESNPDHALTIGEHLSSDGHRPAIVFTVDQARSVLDAGTFDVVLVEASAAGHIDGVGLAGRLRAAGRPEVVVVMLDVRSPQRVADAIAAGAGACVGKPVGREELFSAIQSAVLQRARLGS